MSGGPAGRIPGARVICAPAASFGLDFVLGNVPGNQRKTPIGVERRARAPTNADTAHCDLAARCSAQ